MFKDLLSSSLAPSTGENSWYCKQDRISKWLTGQIVLRLWRLTIFYYLFVSHTAILAWEPGGRSVPKFYLAGRKMKESVDSTCAPALYSMHKDDFLSVRSALWTLLGEAEQDVDQPAQCQEPDLGPSRPSGGPQPAQYGQCTGHGGPAGGEHHRGGQQAQLHLQQRMSISERPSM